MYCKHCQTRSKERDARQGRKRRSRTLKCEGCGALIVVAGGASAAGPAGSNTGAQLARFGLAVTGDPLLELERKGT